MSDAKCPLCDTLVDDLIEDNACQPCGVCGGLVFQARQGPLVLLAHKSQELCRRTGEALLEAGFSVVQVANGSDAVRILESSRPACVVLDVGLEEVLFFDLIQIIRARPELSGVKVVLIASVYSHTAYKRKPNTLHGADDYVEQHHLTDMLPGKIRSLLKMPASDVRVGAERRVEDADAILHSDRSGDDRLRAMALTIVSDIAMYCEEGMQEVLKTGRSEPLEKTLEEGRHLLRAMSGRPWREGWDPIQEAFDELLERLGRSRRH